MDQRIKPSARIAPLPPEYSPELKEQFEGMRKNLGLVPNSFLIMQRKPKMADVESRRVHLQFVMKRPLAKRGSSSSSIFDWLGFSGDDPD
jgi:hypothetical protein